MMKTVVKFAIIWLLVALLFSPLFHLLPMLFAAYTIVTLVFFGFYYYWKRAHTYYIKENSILITRSWVFGTYQREITFDRLHDIHVQQGILARLFNCGSLVFATTAGLEVGYVGVGAGRRVFGGAAVPRLVRGAWNSFLDVKEPSSVRELAMQRLVAWREVFQQQRIAAAVERMAPQEQRRMSVSEELSRLKELLDKGAITKDEYEKLKKKLIESE